jgi:parvulin-like peptidyl-prolyl isomerase
VTDAEAEARMPKHLAVYKVRQLVVQTLGEAEEVRARLDRGEDMAALVQESSIGPEARKEGLLWDIREGMGFWPPEDEAKILDLPLKTLYGPFQMGLGYAIVRVEEKKDPPPDYFRKLRNKFRNNIEAERFKAALDARLGDRKYDIIPEDQIYLLVRDYFEKGEVRDVQVARHDGLTISFREMTLLEKTATDTTDRPTLDYKFGKFKAMPENLIKDYIIAQEARRKKHVPGPNAQKAIEVIRNNALAGILERREIDPQVKVTEAELRPYFEANKERFGTAEAVRVRHILTKDPAEARRILEDARSGMDFETMAKAFSMDPGSREKGGDLGFVERGKFVKEFEDPAFSMTKPGEVYKEPIKSPYGYHVIRFEGRRAATAAKFEEVKREVRLALEEEKRSRAKGEYVLALMANATITRDEAAIERARDAFVEDFRDKTESKQKGFQKQHGPGKPGKFHKE